MNFLRTLGWILLTVVVVVFSLRNWAPVTINLFAGLQADVKLPVLLLIAFLVGFGPLYVYHRAVRWTLRKKLYASGKMGLAPLAEGAAEAPPAFASGEPGFVRPGFVQPGFVPPESPAMPPPRPIPPVSPVSPIGDR